MNCLTLDQAPLGLAPVQSRALARTVARMWVLCACALSGWAQAALPIEHWQDASGARVYFVHSPAIPMLDVQIDFDAGSRRDPADKAGLASAALGRLSNGIRAVGSAPALDENQLGEAWADLGARFSGSVSSDRASFFLRTLTEPDLLARAVALAARQMAQPQYDLALWQRDRTRSLAALKESQTQPGYIGNRAFDLAVYGNHPYGQSPSEASLTRIAPEDLHAWHARSLWACRAVVSVVGALSRSQAERLVRDLLTPLVHAQTSPEARRCQAAEAVPEVQALTQGQALRIAHASAQSHVWLGQPGFARRDPDFFALLVGNHILGGGGFVSRLVQEVREKRGLSYSVSSQFSPGAHAGSFEVHLQTRPDQADQALALVREVVGQFLQNGPTPEELKAAQANLIGGFGLRLDNNRKLLGQVANIAWYGLPLDYLDRWTERIAAVTVQDIQKAMQRVLQAERMVSVVVGPSAP